MNVAFIPGMGQLKKMRCLKKSDLNAKNHTLLAVTQFRRVIVVYPKKLKRIVNQ